MPAQEVVTTDPVGMGVRLLHRARLADPTAGLWEAADLQWWSRKPRASDRDGHLFWADEHGEPVAAVILTDWGSGPWELDVITLPDPPADVVELVWSRGLSRVTELGLGSVEMIVRDDDRAMRALIADAGFTPTGETGASSWLDAARRPDVTPLPDGFTLRTRADTADRPHHLIARNGPDVAARLAQCSLYDPELDLLVDGPDGDVAAYCLFWADPVTGVGLVEPMRTEEKYWRRGLGRHLLAVGTALLAARGCTRIKVSSAIPLYRAVGFVPGATDAAYVGPSTGDRR